VIVGTHLSFYTTLTRLTLVTLVEYVMVGVIPYLLVVLPIVFGSAGAIFATLWLPGVMTVFSLLFLVGHGTGFGVVVMLVLTWLTYGLTLLFM